MDRYSCFQSCLAVGVDVFLNARIDFVKNDFHLFFTDLGNDLFFHLTEFFDLLMTEHQCVQHQIFADFMSTGFNHVESFLGTGNCQIDLGSGKLFDCRIDNKLAIDITDFNAGDRTVKRNIGNT